MTDPASFDPGGRHPPPNRRPSRDRRSFACEDCGGETVRKRTCGEPLICTDCGITRAVQAAREMHNKSGPAYDRFLSSNGVRGRPRQTRE